jgi:hypothetical protein
MGASLPSHAIPGQTTLEGATGDHRLELRMADGDKECRLRAL